MTTLTDTSPEALRVLIDCHRRMTPEGKWRVIRDSLQLGRALHAAGARMRLSGATDADIQRDWLVMHFGKGPWVELGASAEMLNQPIEQQQVIRETLTAFDRIGVRGAIGGSIASSIYGLPRYTRDVDLTAEPFAGCEEPFASLFNSDYYFSVSAIQEAIATRQSFNIIHLPSGFKIDVFIQKPRPFDQQLLERRIMRTDLDSGGEPIPILTPEDVLLFKFEWIRLGRGISDCQWSDILGVLRVQAGRLDEDYLDQWAGELGVSDLLAKARADAVI